MASAAWTRSEPSHRRHRRRRRADSTRQPQRRRGEEEAAALFGAEIIGELGKIPDLAQIDAELEETVLVQGERRAMLLLAGPRGKGFHRVVVGDERRESALGDPVEEP